MANSSTFVEITNKDIYDKLETFEKNFLKFHEVNQIQHKSIISKTAKAQIIAGTALSIVLILLTVVITHIAA